MKTRRQRRLSWLPEEIYALKLLLEERYRTLPRQFCITGIITVARRVSESMFRFLTMVILRGNSGASRTWMLFSELQQMVRAKNKAHQMAGLVKL
jgi:hypothetical protein